jgi:hypothetical protein
MMQLKTALDYAEQAITNLSSVLLRICQCFHKNHLKEQILFRIQMSKRTHTETMCILVWASLTNLFYKERQAYGINDF